MEDSIPGNYGIVESAIKKRKVSGSDSHPNLTSAARSNHYTKLGIRPDADIRTIHAAYKGIIERVKTSEVFYDEPTEEERCLREKKINELREIMSVLSNPRKRAEYDSSLLDREPRPHPEDGRGRHATAGWQSDRWIPGRRSGSWTRSRQRSESPKLHDSWIARRDGRSWEEPSARRPRLSPTYKPYRAWEDDEMPG